MKILGGTPHRPNLRRISALIGVAFAGVAAVAAITWPLSASGDGPQRPEQAHAHADRSAPGRYVAPAAPEDKGTGRDPLTAAEERASVKAALGDDRLLRTQSKDVAGHVGDPQLISTALAEDEEDAKDRTAEVSFYDYGNDSLVVKSVDLATGKVTDSQTAHGAQPPPGLEEGREAAKLLIESPSGEGLRQDYQRATGEALTSADQLTVQGLVRKPRPTDPPELEQCGQHRCVTLFTRVKDGPWIDTRAYVIDLSERTVHHD